MFEEEIRAFEAEDRLRPPPEGAVLFIGSSSIRMWETLGQDFPGVPVINRGFGGSEMEDTVRYAHRIALPYKPRQIVVYAGDNDLGGGKAPEAVADAFASFVRLVHAQLPATRIGFVAIKPSLMRWHLIDMVRKTNGLVREICARDPRLDFIDIVPAMLGDDGMPRQELYVEDGLHLSVQGYAIWRAAVAPFLG